MAGAPARILTASAIVASVLSTIPGPARGADPSSGVLRRPRHLLVWQGAHFDSASAGSPEACTEANCDTFLATIRIRPRYWNNHPGHTLEFAIRWPSEYDDFDLYVYRPNGSQVPTIQSNVGSAEATQDPNPRRGTYRVVVVPKQVTDSDYEGAIQVEPARRFPGPTRDLLPNLTTVPPRHFIIAAPAFYQTGEPIPSDQVSCYVDETTETGHTRCLRFDNIVANVGRGDLRMRFNYETIDSDRVMEQIIQRTDGSVRYRRAGQFEYHATHGHLHYEGFAGYRLFAVVGDRLEPASEGVKSGFCLEDTELRWWTRRGNGPMGITFPDCDIPRYQDEDGTWGEMGITRGWADVYTWDLPDQYVPIDGLDDGLYVLETRADASGLLREVDETDNTAWALLRITGNDVEVLAKGRGPAANALAAL